MRGHKFLFTKIRETLGLQNENEFKYTNYGKF